jgi:uncharacterized protein (UPF0548 family)
VTREQSAPDGYRCDTWRRTVGSGDAAWERAKDGLRQWVAHTGVGGVVVEPNTALAAGETVVVALRTGPVWAVAPCRIVLVLDDAERYGFAYGTLPGHPARGEESFVVSRDLLGNVVFSVVAISQPAATLAKLGAPVARATQRRISAGYLDALGRYVNSRGR